MKNYAFVASLLISLFGNGQKSIYFSTALPPASDAIAAVDPQYFGNYKSANGSITYIVADSGIYTSSIQMSSIPKQKVREEGKYLVRNGYLHGVTKDSVPCVLEKGYYYFGIRTNTNVIGTGSLNQLKNIRKGEYIINFEEGQNYTPLHVKFDGNSMTMSYFDYTPETKKFDFIVDQHEVDMGYLQVVMLNPTEKEYEQVMKFFPFTDETKYKKEN